MFRTSLLAAVSCLVALSPALADGGNNPRLTGLGEFGLTYLNLDGPNSDDVNVYQGSGSALWTWPDKWNVQGDYSFGSYRFDGPNTVDLFKLGGAVFWRDSSDFALGGQLHYQSLDSGVENDGVALSAFGEKYWDEATLAGYIAHSSFDGAALDIDGWQLGARGTYYADPQLAWKFGFGYGTWDDGGDDIDTWDFSGEVEYLVPDLAVSLFGGLGFGSLHPNSTDETDSFRIGAGFRVHFGTQGSLRDRNRAEPIVGALKTEFTY